MNYEELHASPDNKPLRTISGDLAKQESQQPKTNRFLQKPIQIDSHASVVKIIVIATAVIGAILGIICGAVFPITELRETGLYSSPIETVEKFNAGMMIAIWAGTAVTSLSWLVLYWFLDSIENVLIELKIANRYHEQGATKEE